MIRNIKLQNFRNFEKKEIEFSSKTTLILGPNATGKTNILESVFLVSTGKSFKARLEEEIVNYNSEIARISASVDSGSSVVEGENSKTQHTEHHTPNTNLEVVLTRGLIDIGAERPEKVPRKKLMVNGVARHLYNFASNLKVVLFSPSDMDLVTESPSVRRKFLDNVLSQTDREYRRALLSYEKGVRQRNRLLWRIREEGISRSSLLFWDQLLIKNGDYIAKQREEFIEFVNASPDFKDKDYSLQYDKSAISEGRLEQYKVEEVASATTLVGPHRDDFTFAVKKGEAGVPERDLSRFGSRGEQRMGVLWLKLAELDYIKKTTNENPTLLLDDIFSELDHLHREIVFDVTRNQQSIITTADEHFIADFKNVGSVVSLKSDG